MKPINWNSSHTFVESEIVLRIIRNTIKIILDYMVSIRGFLWCNLYLKFVCVVLQNGPGLNDLMILAIQNGMKIKHLCPWTWLVGQFEIHRNYAKIKWNLNLSKQMQCLLELNFEKKVMYWTSISLGYE